VLDRRYASFGILGENVFAAPSHTFDPAHSRNELFFGRGAPRAVSAGLQLAFE
jgi:iron complex outermembrane receptor protein